MKNQENTKTLDARAEKSPSTHKLEKFWVLGENIQAVVLSARFIPPPGAPAHSERIRSAGPDIALCNTAGTHGQGVVAAGGSAGPHAESRADTDEQRSHDGCRQRHIR